MKLTFLGTGSAINAGDFGASLLINENILIDAPEGITQTLRKFGGDISGLDTIIITHLHGDHVFGLPFLLLEYMLKPRESPLSILAPAGAQKLLIKLTELAFPGEEAERMLAPARPFYIVHADGKGTTIKNISIKSHRIPHGSIETYGIEVGGQGGKKIFYAPDISYSDELVNIIETVDVAILDATTSEPILADHMSMKQVNDLAGKFPGKEFMLTHRSRYEIKPTTYSFLANVRVPVAGDEFTY
jgi:ribonuclease BN (tRNA processing enzyme)